MAQKTIFVPEIGELILSKRRGATHMRISINAAGKVRVGMPYGEKSLKIEAEHLLPMRLKLLARQHGYEYKDVQIRKLISRWGSCSSVKVITLSYYLIQLPWNLIDYVIIHELIHTQHMHHGKEFWDDFKKIMPDARALQKEIRHYKPLIQSYKITPGK
jgi:predicted metal-dependent hydrolase